MGNIFTMLVILSSQSRWNGRLLRFVEMDRTCPNLSVKREQQNANLGASLSFTNLLAAFLRSPPVPLMKLIDSTSLRMTEMMSEAGVPFGEFLDTSSDSEAQNVSLALMLAWKLLVKFFRSMPQETRVVYAKYIKQHKLVHSLLVVLFRLIPLKKIGVVITEESQPIIGRFCGQRTVQEMACSVYYSLSQWMPAIVRQWWNGLDKHRSSIVDRFVDIYCYWFRKIVCKVAQAVPKKIINDCTKQVANIL